MLQRYIRAVVDIGEAPDNCAVLGLGQLDQDRPITQRTDIGAGIGKGRGGDDGCKHDKSEAHGGVPVLPEISTGR